MSEKSRNIRHWNVVLFYPLRKADLLVFFGPPRRGEWGGGLASPWLSLLLQTLRSEKVSQNFGVFVDTRAALGEIFGE